MKNQVQLIAYVDRCGGGTFRELQGLLEGPLQGAFGGVHVLPFFTPIDGADAGFDPIDHTAVDGRRSETAEPAAAREPAGALRGLGASEAIVGNRRDAACERHRRDQKRSTGKEVGSVHQKVPLTVSPCGPGAIGPPAASK